MIKFFISVFFTLFLLLSSIAQASILPLNSNDLTADDYIVYNYNGVVYDIAWVSKVNSERYYELGAGVNTMLSASFRDGWEFATSEQLTLLQSLAISGELSNLLTRDDGTYIDAFQYWNDFYLFADNTRNIDSGLVGSEWVWSIAEDDTYAEGSLDQALEIANRTNANADTFYFRASSTSGGGTVPVPEPSTLMIFALALIALASRKRLFK